MRLKSTAIVTMCVSRSNATAFLAHAAKPLPPDSPTAPSPPVSITFLLVNSTSLYVTWEVPEFPQGVIEFYQVEYSSICSVTTRINTTDNSTFAMLSRLSPFTNYTVRVRAFTVEFGNFSTEQRKMTSEAGGWMMDMHMHAHTHAHAHSHTHAHTLNSA